MPETHGTHIESRRVFLPETVAIPAGTVVGERYRLRERLGQGGFGVVYDAEQFTPVQRRVAVKLIREGRATDESRARFLTERQAIASLDHPNIARLIDAGEMPDGAPFFVLEHVAGLSADKFARAERLGVHARVKLIVQLCEAVEHAHARGIIHRDITPANVLVQLIDEHPRVKLIDFGISCAQSRVTPGESPDDTGRIVGTPAYMSPEQARSTVLGVDVRADVYGVGAVLYHLLALTPPAPEASSFATSTERLAEHLESSPVVPPTVRLRDEPSGYDPSMLPLAAIEGDLEYIVMQAIARARTDRYPSVAALRADLNRYLGGLPVRGAADLEDAQRQRIGALDRVARAQVALLKGVLTDPDAEPLLRRVLESSHAEFVAVVEENVGELDAQLWIVESLHRAGRHPEAERLARLVSARAEGEPDRFRALDLAAKSALAEGHSDRAVAAWEEALAAAADAATRDSKGAGLNHRFRATFNLSIACMQKGDLQRSRECFEEARAISEAHHEFGAHLAGVLEQGGLIAFEESDAEDALASFRSAAAHRAAMGESRTTPLRNAHYLTGMALAALERFGEATEAFHAAADAPYRHSSQSSYLDFRAMIYEAAMLAASGDPGRAADMLRDARSLAGPERLADLGYELAYAESEIAHARGDRAAAIVHVDNSLAQFKRARGARRFGEIYLGQRREAFAGA